MSLQHRISVLSRARETDALVHSSWKARRHIKVGFRDGGFVLERCEQEPCFVDGMGLATCGRIACPSCGRGSANLSAWQFAALTSDELVACDCGHLWVPVPTTPADMATLSRAAW